MNKANLSF